MAAEDSSQPPPDLGTNPSPTEEAIRQQLAKILTSPQFVNSPNLRQLSPLHRGKNPGRRVRRHQGLHRGYPGAGEEGGL